MPAGVVLGKAAGGVWKPNSRLAWQIMGELITQAPIHGGPCGSELAWLTPGPFERKRNGSRNAEEKDFGRVTGPKVRGS